MRFVPVKSVQQQADLSLHRVRQGFIEERTATLNRIRGLLAEFGYVLANGAVQVRRQVPPLLEVLPARVARCVRDLLEHADRLTAKALEYEREIRMGVRDNELARRAHTRQGIGPITASALVATVGNGHDFKNGRQFAAWLGLVPRQYSTGGKTRLGHITKRGDPYLRTYLSWAHAPCCSVRHEGKIRSRAGPWLFRHDAVITALVWPSLRRTPVSPGPCSRRSLARRNRSPASPYCTVTEEIDQALPTEQNRSDRRSRNQINFRAEIAA